MVNTSRCFICFMVLGRQIDNHKGIIATIFICFNEVMGIDLIILTYLFNIIIANLIESLCISE